MSDEVDIIQEKPKEYQLRKSFVAFIDILGFKKLFDEDKNTCIELLSEFSEHNGEYSSIIDPAGIHTLRPTAICFSDNIALIMPAEVDMKTPKDFHAHLWTLLHAVSFFSYKALTKGIFLRGALSYGDMYQTGTILAGKPLIEAVDHEKMANYPRIILANAAKKIIEEFHKQHSNDDIFCFKQDETDGTLYFDWLDFYIKAKREETTDNIEFEKIVMDVIESEIKTLNEKIKSIHDVAILQKLYWMKIFLEKHKVALNEMICAGN